MHYIDRMRKQTKNPKRPFEVKCIVYRKERILIEQLHNGEYQWVTRSGISIAKYDTIQEALQAAKLSIFKQKIMGSVNVSHGGGLK